LGGRKIRDDGEEDVKLLLTPWDVAEDSAKPTPLKQGECDLSKEVQAQVDAIMTARLEPCKLSSTPRRHDDPELKDKINAILSARKNDGKQELQDRINAIVGAHEMSLEQQRLACASPSPSPSPAKSLSDAELEFYANNVLSHARGRNNPVLMSQSLCDGFQAYEEDLAPRHLSFADGGANDSCDAPLQADAFTAGGAGGWAPMQIHFDHKESTKNATKADPDLEPVKKVEARAFSVTEIPSPTRNRAKKLLAVTENCEAAEQKTAEEEHENTIEQEVSEEEEARRKEIEEARRARELEEQAEIAAMDQMCINNFLESVKRVAWRQPVRTPIKGTNLYTKHMRPCRAEGTSVDVKDSSFMNLGNFLRFLEGEGLLRLQPGLTDPVVSAIDFKACRHYKHVRASLATSCQVDAPPLLMQ
jgi:hypothetical protein